MRQYREGEELEQRVARYLENRYDTVNIDRQSFNSSGYGKVYVDFVLREKSSGKPLILVEVKRRPPSNPETLIMDFRKSAAQMNVDAVRCYLASENQKTHELEFHDYTDLVFKESTHCKGLVSINTTKQLPSIEELSGIENDKATVETSVKTKSMRLVACGIAVLLLDATNYYRISWERLALMAATAVLYLIPSFTKAQFVFGDVKLELEQYERSEESDT